jgi:hypothetical protein
MRLRPARRRHRGKSQARLPELRAEAQETKRSDPVSETQDPRPDPAPPKPRYTYRNREGQVWPLEDLRLHPIYLAMVLAKRSDTGETVLVLQRDIEVKP